MSALNHKNFNNSYETEPSSGSGSPLCDKTNCNVPDESNMCLPFSHTTDLYGNETRNQCIVQISECISLSNKDNASISTILTTLPKCGDISPDKPCTNNSFHSSRGTPFKGFNDSAYDILQKGFIKPVDGSCGAHIDTDRSEVSRITFARFYDMIAEENSCNAVDFEIPTEDISNIITIPIPSEHLNTSQFSFNGQITSIVPSIESGSVPLGKSPKVESYGSKTLRNLRSPDLFEADDNDDETSSGKIDKPYNNMEEEQKCVDINNSLSNTDSHLLNPESFTKKTRNINIDSLLQENCRREEEVLQRIRKWLEGLPPPPSVTIPQLDMFNAVLSRKDKIINFLVDAEDLTVHEEHFNAMPACKSLFRPTHPLDVAKMISWREALGVRQHGFCFNLCGASESNECLALSVIERFVGCETASSYRNSPSSAKKRNARMKLITQSPGNRLSHLARRRATFSSAHLATTSQKTKGLLGHQILLDKKKNKHRRKCTPKRMTPGSKKKNRKTPSSSSRKGVSRCDLLKIGPLREASKRALFQSPPKELQHVQPSYKFLPNIKPEIANRIEKSKRALFSADTFSKSNTVSENGTQACKLSSYAATETSSNMSNFQINSELKRKRDFLEENDLTDLPSQSNKLFRGGAENLTPRALKIKSQSFCIGANVSSATNLYDIADNSRTDDTIALDASMHKTGNVDHNRLKYNGTTSGCKIQRAHSEMVAHNNSLTENQRKKLLWAVSQALQEKRISTTHEHFKQYAAVLARIVRRLFQEFFQKSSTSNSETLLRLAKRYVHNVINGSSADDIYLQAKAKIGKDKSQQNLRLSGYIGPEEYERRKNSTTTLCNGIVETLPSSPSQLISVTFERISKSMTEEVISQHSTKLPVQPNTSLQNSSSKNNNCGLALRENVNFECEQRRSGQKNFTGKDQRNVSPYATLCNSVIPTKRSATVTKKELHNFSEFSLLCDTDKVKRQITFDN